MAPRSKKGSTKSTTSSKAKATKKRSFPQEEDVTADVSTAATGKKPAKRMKTSTTGGTDVEAKTQTPHTTKGVAGRSKKATPLTSDAPTSVSPEPPAVSTTTLTAPTPALKSHTNIFTGSFDLYSMDTEALNIAYAPPCKTDTGEFDEGFYPEPLYKAIRASKPETKLDEDGDEVVVGGPVGKLTIPIPHTNTHASDLDNEDEDDDDEDEDEDEDDNPYGTLTLSTFGHPYCGGYIEIAVIDIKEQSQEDLDSEIETPDLGRPTEDAWDEPGISATLDIQDYQVASMIPEASGKLCMRPLWKGVDEHGKVAEIFEGSLTFQCSFDRIWWKRGGKGREEDIVFWAVRELA